LVVANSPRRPHGASGQFGEDAGHGLEVERFRRGQGWSRALEPAFVGEDDRCGFGKVDVGGPRHRPVGWRDELPGLERLAEQAWHEAGVEAVPQGGEGCAGAGQVLLGGGVVGHRREQRVGACGLVARYTRRLAPAA